MAQETGPSVRQRWLRDKLKMLGAAGLFILLGGAAFWFADEYHVNVAWVFMVIVSLSFFPVAGWDYRSQFKSPSFAIFFGIWMLLHGLTFVVVMKFFGWLAWMIAVIVELFFFYLTLSWVFELPLPLEKEKDE